MPLNEKELKNLSSGNWSENRTNIPFPGARNFQPYTFYTRDTIIFHEGALYRARINFQSGLFFNLNDWELIAISEETDPVYSADKPNIAFINKENVFVENQQFNNDVNVDGTLTAHVINAGTSLMRDGKEVATSEELKNAMLATQTWLPAVQTVSQLPVTGLDPNLNYLCKVLNDTPANNGVWQAVAGWTANPVWTYFSDNVEFVNNLELQDAINQHDTNLNPHSGVVVRRNEMGQPNGVASLDGTGRVPMSQLPDIGGGGGETESNFIILGSGWQGVGYVLNGKVGMIFMEEAPVSSLLENMVRVGFDNNFTRQMKIPHGYSGYSLWLPVRWSSGSPDWTNFIGHVQLSIGDYGELAIWDIDQSIPNSATISAAIPFVLI